MEIELSAIARNYRLFAKPAALTTIGVVGALLIDPAVPATTPIEQMFLRFQDWLFLGLSAIALFGSTWALYRAWLEWRWENGELDGDCRYCAGPVETMRRGYCRCLICGSRQRER